ncbi:hypothetical protein CTI14_19345 [Methylobacterium radiotolerans]|nr:hypothetical protein CTI14_19345 [Methylobacterium radiotolerans]
MEIQIDELGWTRYLNGEAGALENIEAVIAGFERRALRDGGATDTNLIRVAAKAYRHKAAMLAESDFAESQRSMLRAAELANRLTGRDRQAQLAHATFGRAQIVAMHLGITESGDIDLRDQARMDLITSAIRLAQEAQEDYEDMRDYGRVAKALTLRVRLMSAKGDRVGAQMLAPLRDRAVQASNWSRDGADARMVGLPRRRLGCVSFH